MKTVTSSKKTPLSERAGALTLDILDKNADLRTPQQKRRLGRLMIGTMTGMSAMLGSVFLMNPSERVDPTDQIVNCAAESLPRDATFGDAILALDDCGIYQVEQVNSPMLDDLALDVLEQLDSPNS